MTANTDPRAPSTRLARLLYKTGTYSNIWPPELATKVKGGSQSVVFVSPTDSADKETDT